VTNSSGSLLDHLDNIQFWLSLPTTWVAIFIPALITVAMLLRHGLNRTEAVAMLAAIPWGCLLAQLKEVDGTLQLHTTPLFIYGLLLLGGLRLYLPPPGKALAMAWVVLLFTDLGGMMLWAGHRTDVQLPLGIGGAGFGDALFVHPLIAAIGLMMLAHARRLQPPLRLQPVR